MTGRAQFERMVFRFQIDPDPQKTLTCAPGTSCVPVDCCPDAEAYQYQLASPGTNPNVPFIPTPSDVTPTWTSTQVFTAHCPPGSTGDAVTATGSATSTISQLDADQKALLAAQTNAVVQLKCSTCTPNQLLLVDVAAGDTYDFSAYFGFGYLPGAAGQQFRVVDEVVLINYATGIIVSDGTLDISYARETGTEGIFDPGTFVFTNNSAVMIPVALEIACPTNSGALWPSSPNVYG